MPWPVTGGDAVVEVGGSVVLVVELVVLVGVVVVVVVVETVADVVLVCAPAGLAPSASGTTNARMATIDRPWAAAFTSLYRRS
jgi:hypothetical protein